MTVLLICNKKERKNYAGIISETKHTLLGFGDTNARGGIVANIIEYNPHVLIWENNITRKQHFIDFRDMISDLRTERPNLRIIWVHGVITDEDEFKKTCSLLSDDNVFDIIGDFAKVAKIIDNPMTADDFVATEQDIAREIQEASDEISIMYEPEQPTLNSEFDYSPYLNVDDDNSFDFDKIVTISL
ncbi:MAG: hypothetical protein FWG45_06790 [Oscillospiraceae bacterium]|nr:hypothetical protein [Oscillospiraceae bacterium]